MFWHYFQFTYLELNYCIFLIFWKFHFLKSTVVQLFYKTLLLSYLVKMNSFNTHCSLADKAKFKTHIQEIISIYLLCFYNYYDLIKHLFHRLKIHDLLFKESFIFLPTLAYLLKTHSCHSKLASDLHYTSCIALITILMAQK